MMRTHMHVRASSWILLLGLCLGLYPGCRGAGVLGKHDGVLEGVQAVTLLSGGLVAALAAYQQRGMAVGKIWWVAAMGWRVCSAMSWQGTPGWCCRRPRFGWMRGSVCPAAGCRGQRWLQRGRMQPCCWPGCTGCCATVCSAVWWRAGGMKRPCPGAVCWWACWRCCWPRWPKASGPAHAPDADTTRSVMGGDDRVLGHAALWWAQWLLLHHMQDWRLSSY